MDEFKVIRETVTRRAERPDVPVQLPSEPSLAFANGAPYVLPENLAMAVNVALAVDQPLLVTGEPGCGKTSLAWAVAEQLGTHVEEFHTKSTSTARDLLYTVDSLRRFHDASAQLSEARDPARYVKFDALGRAIRSQTPVVVLIDEVDKAPRDFPNDLLHEIDRKAFTVMETGETFRQSVRHFILVTSNGERRLPDAFLRRCVYAHVPFPASEVLCAIVLAHCAQIVPNESFVATAVRRFTELRQGDLDKRPATSELIAWVMVLRRMRITEELLAKAPLAELPALELLVKVREDRERLGA